MVTLPSGAAQVQWRRNARARRVSLRIDPSDGAIVVTLPPRASRRAGMALLMDHVDWVTKRIAALPAAVTLADGAEVPIGGVPHIIRHHPDRRGGAWLEDGQLHVTGRPEFLPRRAVDFLRAEAGRRLAAQARAKSAQAGCPGADLHQGHHQPLGQLRARRSARVQLAAGDGARVCPGLRDRA